jgi:hypothetical protein
MGTCLTYTYQPMQLTARSTLPAARRPRHHLRSCQRRQQGWHREDGSNRLVPLPATRPIGIAQLCDHHYHRHRHRSTPSDPHPPCLRVKMKQRVSTPQPSPTLLDLPANPRLHHISAQALRSLHSRSSQVGKGSERGCDRLGCSKWRWSWIGWNWQEEDGIGGSAWPEGPVGDVSEGGVVMSGIDRVLISHIPPT